VELLSAGFASEVRRYLLQRFARVRILLSDTALFPGVLTDAILLMAEGEGGTNHLEVTQIHGIEDLGTSVHTSSLFTPQSANGRWWPSLLDDEARDVAASLMAESVVTPLSTWGRVALGSVTGNNRFFALTESEVESFRIDRHDLVRISPPGSIHLRSFTFTNADVLRLRHAGKAVYLLHPRDTPSAGAQRYIEVGRRAGVQDAYKCRVRTPWWRPPLVKRPDLLLTYMNSDTPRLAANRARVHHLNSVHGLYLSPEFKDEFEIALAVASVNSATLLGAELVGRSYGGGILKLEPGEALNLPLPAPALVRQFSSQLIDLGKAMKRRPTVSVEEIALLVDDLVLAPSVSSSALEALRVSRHVLSMRRKTRGASHKR
jgi:hypothetical protein